MFRFTRIKRDLIRLYIQCTTSTAMTPTYMYETETNVYPSEQKSLLCLTNDDQSWFNTQNLHIVYIVNSLQEKKEEI